MSWLRPSSSNEDYAKMLECDMQRDTPWTFKKVCGYEHAKSCLKTYTDEVHHGSACENGVPRPVLLYGHPGVGKSALLAAAAKEADFKLFVFNLFTPSLRTDTSQCLKTVYNIAQKNAPCILCFEDVDILSKDDYTQVEKDFLSQLQHHLDSLSGGGSNSSRRTVAVIAVAQCPWNLNAAVLNQFKLQHVGLPSKSTRMDMMKLHLRDTSHDLTDVMFDELGEKTEGFSGADICCLVRDAIMHMVRAVTAAKFFKKVVIAAQENETKDSKRRASVDSAKAESTSRSTLAEGDNKSSLAQSTLQLTSEELGKMEQGAFLTEKYVPCQETEEGAIPLTFGDLDPEQIHLPEPMVTLEAMMAALARTGPTIAADYANKMEEFKRKFGG